MITALLAAQVLQHSNTLPAIEGIIQAMRSHRLVGLGESHGSAECHKLFRTLIQKVEVHKLVEDVVVECGNPVYQRTMDRYTSGGNVSKDELQKCWQNTSMLLAWDSPVYKQLFQAVRDSNRGRPKTEQLRVVFVEPPIQWAKVNTPADYEPFAARSPNQYITLKREVLDKGRRALIIYGATHLGKAKDPNARHHGLASYLEANYPGILYSVWPVFGAKPSFLPAGSTAPCLYPVAGTALADESFGQFMPKGLVALKKVDGKTIQVPIDPNDYPPVQKVVDAILYFGEKNTVVPAPSSLYSGSYLREIKRRGAIMKEVFGIDLTADLPD